jgi:catechol 2,3-dioxygenase-like lactoylglutathione lyase family enzyme
MLVRELELKATHPERAARFWGGLLGLEGEEGGRGVAFRAGASTLRFTHADPEEGAPGYHIAFNVPLDRFEEVRAELKRRTELLRGDEGDEVFHFEKMGARALYFRDGGGVIGELIGRPEEDPREPEGPLLIQGISEVGLVARDVEATDRWLRETLGLGSYVPASEDFAAPGSALGMFIVVPREHGWMPAGDPARPHPRRVVLEGSREWAGILPGLPYAITQLVVEEEEVGGPDSQEQEA